ncbi:MAG: hypothetical protein Q7T71_12885, partial [Herbiconiux sp.]|nr:hypothetical protein [Herbiconiux sp.]
MVEKISDNDNGSNNGEGTGRRKTRLFGGRRSSKKQGAPEETATTVSQAPTEPVVEPERPAPAPTVEPTEAPTGPEAALEPGLHDDEPGLAPFSAPASAVQDAPAEPAKAP